MVRRLTAIAGANVAREVADGLEPDGAKCETFGCRQPLQSGDLAR